MDASAMTDVGRVTPESQNAGFRHEALLYDGVDAFVTATSAFIREGIEADEPVLVVVSREKIGLLCDELGSEAARVDFKDMDSVGSNPARIIPAWYDFVANHGGSSQHMRGIGEPISPSRSPDALVECQRHESLLNLAFAGSSAWWLLCPYDTSILDAVVVEEALRSHPHFLEGGVHRTSTSYLDLDAISRPFDRELPEPSTRPWQMTFSLDRLRELREAICHHARREGLGPEPTDNLVIAVNEVATNSLRHGGGEGVLRIWREGDMLTCEVRDRGRIDIPLVGRQRPKAGQEGGFGMWLVHQLCDLVQVRTFNDGSVVRVHMSVNGAH